MPRNEKDSDSHTDSPTISAVLHLKQGFGHFPEQMKCGLVGYGQNMILSRENKAEQYSEGG